MDDDAGARFEIQMSGILTMEFAAARSFRERHLWPDEATDAVNRLSVGKPPSQRFRLCPRIPRRRKRERRPCLYLPWIIKRSKKFSAADLIAITASPGPATDPATRQHEVGGTEVLRAENGFHGHT